mmetsp:Transcript_57903/g.103581  ORF Transcript_57903/g.103581 Transcript_57903/m.103581 type:complete len:205 (-) Transcript_57903:313-927(-)
MCCLFLTALRGRLLPLRKRRERPARQLRLCCRLLLAARFPAQKCWACSPLRIRRCCWLAPTEICWSRSPVRKCWECFLCQAPSCLLAALCRPPPDLRNHCELCPLQIHMRMCLLTALCRSPAHVRNHCELCLLLAPPCRSVFAAQKRSLHQVPLHLQFLVVFGRSLLVLRHWCPRQSQTRFSPLLGLCQSPCPVNHSWEHLRIR